MNKMYLYVTSNISTAKNTTKKNCKECNKNSLANKFSFCLIFSLFKASRNKNLVFIIVSIAELWCGIYVRKFLSYKIHTHGGIKQKC